MMPRDTSLVMWLYSKIMPRSFSRYQLECKIAKLRADMIDLQIKKWKGEYFDLSKHEKLESEMLSLKTELRHLEMGI